MWENLDDAQKNLEDVKKSMLEYLLRTYDEEKTAIKTYNYLAKAVCSIIKKDSLKIEFIRGGDIVWYMTIFNYLANWLEAEKKTSDLLNEELNEDLDR